MIVNKLWKRYFLSEIIKFTCFILTCFYGLYVLIDYSYHHFRGGFYEVIKYYLFDFSLQIDTLLPFALLISSIRCLCQMNIHHELIALMAAGLSLQKLMRPFLFVGLCGVCLLYLNNEFLVPQAFTSLNKSYAKYVSKKAKNDISSAQNLVLEDGSILIYQKFNSDENSFYDVYWIKNSDELFRMEFLYITDNQLAAGKNIEHLIREPEGNFLIKNFIASQDLPEIRFNKQKLMEKVSQTSEKPLSELWNDLPIAPKLNEKHAQITAAFHQKLVTPWLCLLAILGPAPACLRTTRNLPTFFIYSVSIFGLVALNLFLDAGKILVQRQVLNALWAIWVPFFMILASFSWNFFFMGKNKWYYFKKKS